MIFRTGTKEVSSDWEMAPWHVLSMRLSKFVKSLIMLSSSLLYIKKLIKILQTALISSSSNKFSSAMPFYSTLDIWTILALKRRHIALRPSHSFKSLFAIDFLSFLVSDLSSCMYSPIEKIYNYCTVWECLSLTASGSFPWIFEFISSTSKIN